MSEKKQTTPTARCPHCGAEYSLCELAVPGELLGKPRANGIIKDPLGKILYVDWAEEPAQSLEYECDACGRPFEVAVQISVRPKAKPEAEDFSVLEASLL